MLFEANKNIIRRKGDERKEWTDERDRERRGKIRQKQVRHRFKKKRCETIFFIIRVAVAVLSFSANLYYLGLPRVKLFPAVLN